MAQPYLSEMELQCACERQSEMVRELTRHAEMTESEAWGMVLDPGESFWSQGHVSTMIFNVAKAHRTTVRGLSNMCDKDLLSLPSFGRKSLAHLRATVTE